MTAPGERQPGVSYIVVEEQQQQQQEQQQQQQPHQQDDQQQPQQESVLLISIFSYNLMPANNNHCLQKYKFL